MRRVPLTGILLTLLVPAFPFAQEPAIRETMTVRLLEVDVRVVDRQGKAVTGLTADDFELYEDGERREITNFAEVWEASGGASAKPESSVATAQDERVPRTLVFFVDVMPWRGLARDVAFREARELAELLVKEGDRASVVSWGAGGAKTVVSHTDDPGAVKLALTVLERGGSLPSEGPGLAEIGAWFTEIEAAAAAEFGGTLDAEAALEMSVRDGRGADALWEVARGRSEAEGKPLVVFFRPRNCRVGLSRDLCVELERDVIPHPNFARRLESITFVTLPSREGEASALWRDPGPGLAYFDRAGVLRVRWGGVPDASTFAAILDGISQAAPHFDDAVRLAAEGEAGQATVAGAVGLAKLGRRDEARRALDSVSSREAGAEAKEYAAVLTAILDSTEHGRANRAVESLQKLVQDPASDGVAAEAWFALGMIQRNLGNEREAVKAFEAAARIAPKGSAEAQAVSDTGSSASVPALLRILPPPAAISGRAEIHTAISSLDVARVEFFLDGASIVSVDKPPFSALLDLGRIPVRHTIRAVAYDASGAVIGSDQFDANDAEERFWIRIVRPEAGQFSGSVDIEAAVELPRAASGATVRFEWNDRTVSQLSAEPWVATISIPGEEVGVLRAVVALEDGRTAEDAILVNAPGYSERAEVRFLEIPVTVQTSRGEPAAVTAADLLMKGDRTRPRIESLAGAGEAPLTIGILLDSSASILPVLADLQDAAIRFLRTVLREGDRAFLITFDSEVRLEQPATSDLGLLEKKILSIRPRGLTALYDAVVLGTLQFQAVQGRRALVIFSDGMDRTSRYGAAAAAELTRRTGVPVHMITTPRTSQYSRSSPPSSGPGRGAAEPPMIAQGNAQRDAYMRWRAQLGAITRPTGGKVHLINTLDNLPAIFDSIAAHLAAQKVALVRVDPAMNANEWRPIEVVAVDRTLDVVAPEGYYAPR